MNQQNHLTYNPASNELTYSYPLWAALIKLMLSNGQIHDWFENMQYSIPKNIHRNNQQIF